MIGGDQSRVHFLSVWLLALGLLLILGNPTARAHGGIIIDSGFTEEYEWLIAASPFPITTDANVLTLLVYDAGSFEPVNGLDVSLYLVPPGEETPCCDSRVHVGPIVLLGEPDLFPGDYSEIVTPAEAGEWEAFFTVQAEGANPVQIVTVLSVQEGAHGDSISATNGSTESAGAVNTTTPVASEAGGAAPDVAATATAFAQNVDTARRQLGGEREAAEPASAPVRPAVRSNTNIFTGDYWWLWIITGVVALLLVAVIALRPAADDEG